MANEFSKGKWRVLEGQSKGYFVVAGEDQSHSTLVADCDVSILLPHREKVANAKLIASAPDMLEALQSANNYFIDLQNKCALSTSDERAWRLISKAINKVVG